VPTLQLSKVCWDATCATGWSDPYPSTGSWRGLVNYKIAIYGFGSFPVIARHLIDMANQRRCGLKWCAILIQPNYRKVIEEILPREEILDLFAVLPRTPQGGDMSPLAHYPGSLAEDLAALKRSRRKRSGQWTLKRGIDHYRLFKAFLVERGVTHLLMSVIETFDAKIAVAVARELGIQVIAPVDLRNLTGTMFTTDCHETPPAYAVADECYRQTAREFIAAFRRQQSSARPIPIYRDSVADDDVILESYMPALPQRMGQFLVRILERPDLFDIDLIRVSIMNNFGFIRTVRRIRARRNLGFFDIESGNELPNKFIFYPLQYSPEASINTPAPYFVDQFRVIDALRFAMPSDYVLVVKEHPACLEMRPIPFMRRVQQSAGVRIAKVSIPATEIIKRAALTVTVTGTAAFEGFLMGRSTLALGSGMSAWVLGGVSPLGTLREGIVEGIANPPKDEMIVEQVARLFGARYPFFFNSAHMPGEPMLRRGNLRRFLEALLDHLRREEGLMANLAARRQVLSST
jgi:hypothetical protein